MSVELTTQRGYARRENEGEVVSSEGGLNEGREEEDRAPAPSLR